jgi:hypothetical protein
MKIYYWIWGDPSSKIELQPYCGGTTVVAANSKEEAKELIREKYIPISEYNSPVLDIDCIYEIIGASMDIEKPKILIEEGYVI